MVLTSKFCFRGLHGRLRNKSRGEFGHGGLRAVPAESDGRLECELGDRFLTVDSHASTEKGHQEVNG